MEKVKQYLWNYQCYNDLKQGAFTHYVITFGTDFAPFLPLFLFEDIY